MANQKALIFDSSSIITLALNNLLYVLVNLKEKFNGSFLITEDVKKEVIDKPLQIKKFELEALMIQQMLNEKVLEMPSSLNISAEDLKKETLRIMNIANQTFYAGEWIKIISDGETSCFALSNILKVRGIRNVIVIDERTARMLAEKPENLHKLLERKLHITINANHDNFAQFEGFEIIRSSELCYVANKSGLVQIADGVQLIDALLYAVKYKGCAISTQEIEEIKNLKI